MTHDELIFHSQVLGYDLDATIIDGNLHIKNLDQFEGYVERYNPVLSDYITIGESHRNLAFFNSKIDRLPNHLTVLTGLCIVGNSNLTSLPKYLTIHGDFFFINNKCTEIPSSTCIKGIIKRRF